MVFFYVITLLLECGKGEQVSPALCYRNNADYYMNYIFVFLFRFSGFQHGGNTNLKIQPFESFTAKKHAHTGTSVNMPVVFVWAQ
jgi:hypothetical protein